MARGVAFRLGHRATFTPVVDLNVAGSGMHIHFSLRDAADKPIMYDPKGAYGLSKAAEPFIAGILHHLPALTALTAPSIVSYLPSASQSLGPYLGQSGRARSRGRATRFSGFRDGVGGCGRPVQCRVPGERRNRQPLHGARRDCARRPRWRPQRHEAGRPPAISIWNMTDEQRAAAGIANLPGSLGEALELLQGDVSAREWLGPEFLDAYVRLKKSEISAVEGESDEAICARYAAAY